MITQNQIVDKKKFIDSIKSNEKENIYHCNDLCSPSVEAVIAELFEIGVSLESLQLKFSNYIHLYKSPDHFLEKLKDFKIKNF